MPAPFSMPEDLRSRLRHNGGGDVVEFKVGMDDGNVVLPIDLPEKGIGLRQDPGSGLWEVIDLRPFLDFFAPGLLSGTAHKGIDGADVPLFQFLFQSLVDFELFVFEHGYESDHDILS